MTMLLCLVCFLADDGSTAGPDLGKPVPALKVNQIVGSQAGKEVDGATGAKSEAVIYAFLRSDKWDRPVARVVRLLDEALVEHRKSDPKCSLFIVWIGKDGERAREYLPKVQQSIKLQCSTWNHFDGEVYDVANWQLSGDGPLNIVIAKEGKCVWGRGYATINDDISKKVIEAFKK
jgi:hypothetical protein